MQYQRSRYKAPQLHLKYVLNDAEFITSAGALPSYSHSAEKQYIELARRYCISLENLKKHRANHNFEEELKLSATLISFNENILAIAFKPDASKDEILEAWREGRRMYGLSSSTEPHKENPYNYELVYAIFKARMKQITFPSIFQNYSFGALTGYSGPNYEHKNASSLRAFYHRYQPEVAIPLKQSSI